MAVTNNGAPPASTDRGSDFGGRHFLIGSNVVITVLSAVAIAVVLQWGAFYKNAKIDLTNQGVNSLTDGTERLLEGLEGNVRLTSLYFETDLENEDQAKFRTKVNDLLALYQSANKTKIEVDSFNPLQDHGKREQFVQSLSELKKYKDEITPYKELVTAFEGEVSSRISQFLQGEIAKLTKLLDVVDEAEQADVEAIVMLLESKQRKLTSTAQTIEEVLQMQIPQYGAAQGALMDLYGTLPKELGTVVRFAEQKLSLGDELSAETRDYLSSVPTSYQPLINDLEERATEARSLDRLEFQDLLRQLGPMSNSLVVQTADDAKVIGFGDVWPPMDPYAGGEAFKDRMFKGEQKLTSAILQLTQKEKTAVVFVRFGGSPLFFGGMPGMRRGPAPFTQMKMLLEDANFVVKEWDVSTSNEPPKVDPPPVRSIYVLLRPMQPQPSIRGQQPPKFSPMHMQTVVDQMGDDARVIVMAGWAPGAFGAFPDPYPYDAYLSNKWGIHAVSDELVLRAFPVGPNDFRLGKQSLAISDFHRSDHPIVRNMLGEQAALKWCSPVETVAELPEGVSVSKLLRVDKREGLWGVKDVTKYDELARRQEPVSLLPGDSEGPFTLAVAAEKDNAKIVVVGARDSFTDDWALAVVPILTSQGLAFRQRNPGNASLFLNSLHWLNDRAEWMDVGKPVDIGTIAVEEGSTQMTLVRSLVVLWPVVVLGCGFMVWFVRRR